MEGEGERRESSGPKGSKAVGIVFEFVVVVGLFVVVVELVCVIVGVDKVDGVDGVDEVGCNNVGCVVGVVVGVGVGWSNVVG